MQILHTMTALTAYAKILPKPDHTHRHSANITYIPKSYSDKFTPGILFIDPEIIELRLTFMVLYTLYQRSKSPDISSEEIPICENSGDLKNILHMRSVGEEKVDPMQAIFELPLELVKHIVWNI